jgi:kynureninase
MQALIARGVVGDFRAGTDGDDHILRFGFAPLYLRYVDLWDAVEILRDILASRAWDRPQYTAPKTVT